MSTSKAPEGPFAYQTTPEWAEDLYEAITNTCAAEGFAPVPRPAVIEALAPSLGQGEAKRVTERRRTGRVLRATAYHVEQRGTDEALLLLNVDLHGAATLPWPNNDRTRSEWLHPSPDNLARMEEVVDQQRAVAEWTVARERAQGAQRTLASTAPRAEKDAAVAAVKNAEDELARAQRELNAREQALGGRRPLPVVRAVVEDGVALAALTTEEVRAEVASEVQRYAVEVLQRRARLRSYDLVESLVQEGQRESTVVVLQRTLVIGRDGSRRGIWRGRQVTGNNRADARLQVFGLRAYQLLAGVPQYLLSLEGEEENRRLVLLGLGEVLRRVSTLLNTEYADPDRNPEGRAERALRIAQVPARVVVGARTPERLEESLRQLNIHDHLRGQLNYGDMDRSLGLWSTLVKAYQAKGVLGELLAKEVTHGRVGARELNADAIADALVGARALHELAVLLPPGDEVSPLTLRDVAVRCATVMLFPPVPPRPEGLPPRAHMPTGRYWPVVRAALQEASWAQAGKARVDRRSDVWAAVVAQHFVHRGNPLAARGLFTVRDVQYGVRSDARSLLSLLAACQQGDAEAWEILVRRHAVPGLINAPEPFVTAGQGSEKGEDRKGVRRTPANAVQALVHAYISPSDGVTRELLVSFAEAVLRAPESPSGVGLVPGTFWAPDAHGQPREGTLADKKWFDTVFPKTSSSRKGNTADPSKEDDSADDESETGGESGATTEELDEEIPEDALTRMTQLRSDLPSVVESNRDSVTTVAEQLRTLLAHIEAAVRAREEAGAQKEHPDARILYAEELGEIKKQGVKITELLDAATLTVMSL
ncbi:hypothetical protein KME66_00010 [Streptomyces sp. YPW6]|uniref:hypothetical protein n=1 Tax=Streptomyces sp. YPW6 TaxID=2840373 RepID=UPI001C0BA8AC|nr:hypothetical protein [Streptomyces sp. YPW6]QWQ39576.1 hypothetical protein KME66_00010 [Streptomyces sp. YPW6]